MRIKKILPPLLSLSILMVFFLALALPHLSLAQTSGTSNLSVKLVNPINTSNFQDFLAKVLHIAFLIGVPVVALFIIYSGFLFVTAAGSPDKLKAAKKTFIGTVIGAAILLGAEVLSNALVETVRKF